MALLGCAVIFLASGCENPVSTNTAALAIELSTPQDSLLLGDTQYNIRFNQNIESTGKGALKEGIFLRLDDDNVVEVSPESAEIVGSVIKIALPRVPLNQVVRVRIAAGVIQNSQGTTNQEIIYTSQVVDSAFNTPLELSEPQDSLAAEDEYYSIRFNRNISPYGGKVLKEGIFLRLGDENTAEVSPQSAEIEGFNIKIGLPNLPLNKTVRIRILSGLVEDSRGIINQELIITKEVVDRTFSTPIKLLTPQDSFTLGHTYYNIRFNQEIEAVEGQSLKAGIFLRLGDETTPEVSPESAGIEDSLIRIALPSLKVSQEVRVRIAGGIIQNSQGTPNEELAFTAQVIQDLTAPLLSGSQNSLSNIDTSYRLRFAEEIELAVDQAELNSGITLSIDGTDHSVSQASIDINFPWYLVIDLPELTYAQKLSVFIDAGLVKDASNNTNFALELLDIPIIDKQGPKVLLNELEEITETDAEYILPFDKTLFFVDDAAAAKEGIRLLADGVSLAPAAVAISGGDKLLLTLPNLVGKSSLTISIDAGIIQDENNNLNLSITLPEQAVRRDSVPPRLLDTQDWVLHLSDVYTLRFDEMIRARNGDLAALAAGIRLSIASQAAVSAESASITGNQLIIGFSAQIQSGENLKIDIDDNLVEDRAGNAASGLSLSSQVQIDDVPPELGINSLEMGDDAGEYRLLFNEKISNAGSPGDLKAGIRIRIGSNTAMTMLAAAIESDGKTILLDLPAITAGTAYITVAAGLVQDASNNVNSALSLGPITITDVTPPALLEAGSQDDLIQYTSFHKLKFTETIVPAAGGLPSGVYFSIASGAEKHALSATLLPDGKTLLVEHDRLTQLGASVTFRIAAGALQDEAGNASTTDLSLTQTVKADSLPPVHTSTEDLREDAAELKLRFSEDLSPVSGAALQAGVSVGGGSPIAQSFRIDTGDAAILLVTLPDITAGDQLDITLAARLFEDSSGNANERITLSSIPVLPETVPPKLLPPGSTGIEYTETSYTLVFDEAVFPVGGVDDLAKKIGISVSGNRKVQPISAALVNGGEGVEFYLPDIVRGDTLAISIEEGAVKDKRDNLNEPAALAELSVVDTTPPRLLEAQENVYEITSYTLRFDETITVKADTAAKIKAEVDGQTVAISSAVLGADGQSLQLELAAAPVVDSSAAFSIEAGAVADSSGNDNEARTLSAKTVLNDPTPPALLADQDEIYEDSLNYLIRYDEHVVAAGDAAALASGITLTIDGTVMALSAVSIDSVNRGILIRMPSLSIDQTVDIAIAADTVTDGVGNSNEAASFQKTVLAEITPPTAAENQDSLTDADSSFTIRLSEAVSPTADLAQNIVIWYDNQEHAVSSAALTAGKDGIFVEFSSLPAEASVKFIVEAGTLKDKRDNLNLEFSLPPILVQDVTPPRLLEKQDQFSYVIAFSEDLFLVDGITIGDVTNAISLRYSLGAGLPVSDDFADPLTMEDNKIIMDSDSNPLWNQKIQGGGILYLRFPGGMLRDQAGNVIQEDFDIPPYFIGAAYSLTPIGLLHGGGELRELDPFVEWRIKENDDTGLTRLAASEYELSQNISISIDGGEPFHPIYATADGFLKIYLPPVFEGQSVEITLNQGQVAPTNGAFALLQDPLEESNEEITKIYQVTGHDSRQTRTLAGFYLGDNSVGTYFGQEIEPRMFAINNSPKGFYFDHQFGSIAAFNFPMGVGIDGDGNIYVADTGNHRIRKIDAHGAVTTTHGPRYGSSNQPGPGYLDKTASSSLFSGPTDLIIGDDGYIYVLDYYNRAIRKLSQSEVSTVSIKPDITMNEENNYMRNASLTADSQGNPLLAIHDTAYKMHILSIDRDGNRTSYTNGNINTISDIEMVNGKLYAVKYKDKKLVEITMENGAFSEKTLAPLPYRATALAAADDGSTFYVAESLDIDNKYRISRVSIDSTGNVSTAVVLERFETTGTKLSRDQTVAIYIQGQYIMKDYQYFPVETYSVPLQGCYGLALDDQGHLIVAESFSSLILKVFNPHL